MKISGLPRSFHRNPSLRLQRPQYLRKKKPCQRRQPKPIEPAGAGLHHPPYEPPPPAMRVVVSDIHMSFGSMVVFMVKAAFAAIPAIFIVAMIWIFLIGLLSSLPKRY
ncbi:MAG: hypothetical protein IPK44_03125 [Candidatus Accumulibacter sp.]|uniref:hypothetical protein n=1 Tax=Accumulibacter sp. TaxID=2053492 RepID=UPI002583F60F|nr:hypothetical protein [Accumulibacter sp.]MBK8113593.1 hypothetical protein [Accumulibacter sp.]